MTFVFRVLDAKDLRDSGTETVLFDLNDPTGSTNAGLQDLDYATIATEIRQGGDEFSLSAPSLVADRFPLRWGATTVDTRTDLVSTSWVQRMSASSYDALAKAVGYLGRLLNAGGVLKYVPDGSTETRYIDFEPSDAPALIDGRYLGMHFATQAFHLGQGIPITVARQPYLRGPELDPTVNVLVNPTLLHDQDGTSGTPDSWVWDSTSNITVQNIDSADEAFEFTIATGAVRQLQQSTGAASAANGETWTFSFYARSTAAGAKVAPVIEYRSSVPATLTTSTITLTALTTQWQRVSVTFQATDASTDRIRASFRMDNDSATSYVVQFRNAQLEEASSASLFRVGTQTIYADPASTSGPGRTMAIWVQGDAPAPAILQADGSANQYRLSLARAANIYKPGSGRLSQWLNTAKVYQAESATNSTDTANAANANASAGNVKRTTYATASLVSRWTATLDLTTTYASLAGRAWLMVARVANITAQPTTHTLRMDAYTASQVATPGSEVTYISESTSDFHSVPLGIVFIPENAGILALSFNSARVSGTGNLESDCIALVPTDALVDLTYDGTNVVDDLWTLDQGEVYEESGGYRAGDVEAAGSVPLMLEPGLNTLYVLGLSNLPTGTETHYGHALTESTAVSVAYAPRYLT